MTCTAGTFHAILALVLVPGIWGSLPDYPLSKRELKVRSEYYTAGGKYLGGSPKYDEELELYDCTDFNIVEDNSTTTTSCYNGEGNATVCMVWTTNEVSADEYEVGSCACEAITSASYCSAWTCAQTEIATTPTCSGQDEYRTCYYESEQESTRCACDTADDTGAYCTTWSCTETESDGGQEFETYTRLTESSSAMYCEAWTGVIESSEEAEISSCECIQEVSEGGVCSYWECQEGGLTKCSHGGPSWCNLGVSVGVGGFFGFLGAAFVSSSFFALNMKKPLDDSSNMVKIILGFLWMSGWSAGVVVWGGQDGAVYAAIWWGAVILGGFVRRWHRDCVCNCRSVVSLFRAHQSAGVPVASLKKSSAPPTVSAVESSGAKVDKGFDETMQLDGSSKTEKGLGSAMTVQFETPPAHFTTPPVPIETLPTHMQKPFFDDEGGMPVFEEVPGETFTPA